MMMADRIQKMRWGRKRRRRQRRRKRR